VEERFVEGRYVEGRFVGRTFCSGRRFVEGRFVVVPNLHVNDCDILYHSFVFLMFKHQSNQKKPTKFASIGLKGKIYQVAKCVNRLNLGGTSL
jgi:hypothetical protein